MHEPPAQPVHRLGRRPSTATFTLSLAWGKFLTATADEDLETLAMENPVLKQAKDALERLSADPESRVRAEQREMALISYELGLSAARREGRVEGKAESLQQLLTIKFGPLPPDIEARVASANVGQLATWLERILSAATLPDVFESKGA